MGADRYYLRNPKLLVITSSRAVILVQGSGAVKSISTGRAREWSQLMQELSRPVSDASVGRLCADADIRASLWAELVQEGYIACAKDAGTLLEERDRVFTDNQGYDFVPGPPKCGHLVVACTGSVVAGLVAPLILSLWYSRFQREMDVILTEAARKFVTRDLFESYGIRTWVDTFERSDSVYVPHVQLGRSADCILVLPASASSLHRIASTACTDLLSLMVSVTRAPVIVVPVMNDAMWNHVGIQRNISQLRQDGVWVMEPTLIFGAADVASQGGPMFGGHAPMWSGPGPLKHALAAVLDLAGAKS